MSLTQDPSGIDVLSLNSGDPLSTLSNISGVPDGTLVYVPTSAAYFQLSIHSVATPNGSTVIAASGGGNWLALSSGGSSSGVDASGNITPATLTWGAGAVSPTITQAGPAASAQNIILTPQAASANASGSLEIDLAAPGSGSTEAGLRIKRAGTEIAFIGSPNGSGGSTQFTLGPQGGGNGGSFVQQISNFILMNGLTALFLNVNNVGYVGCQSNFVGLNKPLQGYQAGTPFAFGQAAVTLGATGSTALSTAQQQAALLVMSVVTLTGAVTLDFGGVIGNWLVDFSQVTLGGQTVTLKNGAGTLAVTTMLGTKTLLNVSARTAALINAG